jgi:hypothetical protein
MAKSMKSSGGTRMSPQAFANLGEGHIAYIKAMTSDDVNRIFPTTPPIAPGMRLFALLAADGSPILISDSRDAALANAMEQDLQTVMLH